MKLNQSAPSAESLIFVVSGRRGSGAGPSSVAVSRQTAGIGSGQDWGGSVLLTISMLYKCIPKMGISILHVRRVEKRFQNVKNWICHQELHMLVLALERRARRELGIMCFAQHKTFNH